MKRVAEQRAFFLITHERHVRLTTLITSQRKQLAAQHGRTQLAGDQVDPTYELVILCL